MKKTSGAKNVALWVLQVLLAALFLFAGVMKLITPIEEMTKQIAMPGWFLRFIGVAEVLGALGLILPMLLKIQQRLTPIAAVCLGILMAGAVVVSFKAGGLAMTPFPFVVGVLCAVVAYSRWH